MEDEMGGARGTHRGKEKRTQSFTWKNLRE